MHHRSGILVSLTLLFAISFLADSGGTFEAEMRGFQGGHLFRAERAAIDASGPNKWNCQHYVEMFNRDRHVYEAPNAECGGIHTVPFGNWGVDSNYGSRQDTDQFAGWCDDPGPVCGGGPEPVNDFETAWRR